MPKKKRLSRDQKRKAKLTERARKAPPSLSHSSLAYSGNKFKTPALIPVIMRTETAIYEVYVMTDREITDHTVRAALEKLVVQMRAGPLPDFTGGDEVTRRAGQEEDLIIWNIRRNWHDLFQSSPNPGTETLIGVLRTILDSVDTWSTPAPTSRGYLNYIEGFMAKVGVRVREASPETWEELPEPADPFLELGRAWCDGDLEACAEFLAQADALLASGQGQRVVDVTQRLMGGLGGRAPSPELATLSLRAQQGGLPRLG
jgi:hypothetical protein